MNVLTANGTVMLTKDCSKVFIDWSNLMMITMIDTWSGDAFLIKTKNNVTLIDAGVGYKTTQEQERSLYLNTLRNLNIQRINNFILTHNHSDHYGNLPYLVKRMKASDEFSPWIDGVTVDKMYFNGHVLVNNNFQNAFSSITSIAQRGTTLNLGDNVKFEVLWPTADYITKMEDFETYRKALEAADSSLTKWDSTQDYNNSSIVGRLKFGNFSMLFTGDVDDVLSDPFKNWLSSSDLALYKRGGWGYLRDHETVTVDGVTSMPNLESTVYKVSHHGSGHNNPQDIIGYTKAKYAFCSCLGGQNADKTLPTNVRIDYYPRPTNAAINHILNSAANVTKYSFYTTHLHHNVTLLTDGSNVWISCERDDVQWVPRWCTWLTEYMHYVSTLGDSDDPDDS